MYAYQSCVVQAADRHCNDTIADWQQKMSENYYTPHFNQLHCHIGMSSIQRCHDKDKLSHLEEQNNVVGNPHRPSLRSLVLFPVPNLRWERLYLLSNMADRCTVQNLEQLICIPFLHLLRHPLFDLQNILKA